MVVPVVVPVGITPLTVLEQPVKVVGVVVLQIVVFAVVVAVVQVQLVVMVMTVDDKPLTVVTVSHQVFRAPVSTMQVVARVAARIRVHQTTTVQVVKVVVVIQLTLVLQIKVAVVVAQCRGWMETITFMPRQDQMVVQVLSSLAIQLER